MYNEWDKQRRLSDAELIHGGAAFVGHLAVHADQYQEGLLVVNEYQWEKARLVRDVSFRVAEEMGLYLESSEWREFLDKTPLDKPVTGHWERLHPEQDSKVPGILRRQGVDTVRDLLVIGRKKVGEIRNFGPKTVDRLASVVAEKAPGHEWLEEPTAQDIAAFCESIYQVNAKVLLPGKDSFRQRLSVRDVLVLPAAERAEVLGVAGWSIPADLDRREEIAADVYARAELFALRFDLAKGGIWTNPAYLAAE